MRVLTFRVLAGNNDELTAALWISGTCGIHQNESWLAAYFDDESTDLSEVLKPFSELLLDDQILSGEPQLQQSWHLLIEPVHVGSHFFFAADVVSTNEEHGGREGVIIKSSSAFGTGRHESTQLVIEVLENLDLAGKLVLDIGSGTGIQSEVARRLKAAVVIACDIDPDAIAATHTNFPHIPLFNGSADSIADRIADLVIANISARTIDQLSWHLARILKPDGYILLSGFIEARLPLSFRPERAFVKDDWICWLCTRDSLVLPLQPKSIQPFRSPWWQG